MQKHVFNQYDIRGKIGQDLSVEEFEAITHAIISFYKKKNPQLERIAVALDGRGHSQVIYEKVSQAIVTSGLQVYFLGVCPTPVFNFGLHRFPVQAGIMITESHHAKEYNGLKLYLDAKPVWGKDLEVIYDIFAQGTINKVEKVGKITPSPIIDQYIEFIWQEFAHLSQYDFSMIIDCSHGVVGPVIKKLVEKMGWNYVTLLHDTIDGAFPVHQPDPSNLANMKQLHDKLLGNKEAFGIGFDGDASRMIGMESNGSLILGDRLLALFAQDVLAENKNISVVYDSKSSLLVKEVVEQHGGIAVSSSVGFPLVQDTMEQTQALLGGEVSGHYFFKDRHAGYDDGIYALCRLLDILVKERKSLDALLACLPQKYSSYEIRIPCNEVKKHDIIKQIVTIMSETKKWKISDTDGIKVETSNSWGLLRACQTEPMVSFRCEATTKKELLKIKQEFKDLLEPHITADVLKEYF